jgi:hypothetical protein
MTIELPTGLVPTFEGCLRDLQVVCGTDEDPEGVRRLLVADVLRSGLVAVRASLDRAIEQSERNGWSTGATG